MKKRLTIFGMICAMCLCMLIPSGSAVFADSGSVAVTASISGTEASDLDPGDKFYVDVSVSPVSACVFAINASWNTNDLELTDAIVGSSFYSGSTAPAVYVPFYKSGGMTIPEQTVKDYENGNSGDVCVFAFAAGSDVSCSGTVVTLEFTVKQGAGNGLSEIDLYFDEENPPEHFDADHKGADIVIAKGADGKQTGGVTAEITGGQDLDTRAAKPVISPSEGEIERTAIISIMSSSQGTIYYTIDGSDPDIGNGMIFDGYITPNQMGVPMDENSFTLKAVSVEEGLKPSEIAEAKYELPDCSSKASEITVNGSIIKNFDPDTQNYIYQMTYEEWKNGNNIYEIEAIPFGSSARVEYYPGGNLLSFNCDEEEIGAGDNKQVKIHIDSGISTFDYTIDFTVENCSHISQKEEKIPPTCEEPGSYTLSCEICGKVYDSGIDSEPLGHIPGDPMIIEASCVTNGIITVTCQREGCGKEISREIIPAPGHTPGEAVTTPVSCGSSGSRIINCSVCGSEISREVLAPTGNHVWTDNGVCMICGADQNNSAPPVPEHTHMYVGEPDITEATCTSDGRRQAKCSFAGCESYIIEVIPRLQHTEVTESADPDCTTPGYVRKKCGVCGTVISEIIIDATGHNYVFEDVIPDCTETIVLEAQCSECGTTGIKTIEPVGHNEADKNIWKHDENGHYHICSTCGKEFDIDIHTEDNGVITRDPTVEAKGIMTYYCSVCGYEMRTAEIPEILPGTQLPSQGADVSGNPGGIYHEWNYKGEPAGNADQDNFFASAADNGEDISVGAGIAELFTSGNAVERVKMVLAIVCVAGLFTGLAVFRKKRKNDDRNKMDF